MTLSQSEMKRYRKARKEGTRATWALSEARYASKVADLGFEVTPGRVATLERDGFDIRIKCASDVDRDLSYIGEWKQKWEAGCIRNPESRHNSRVYMWFLPQMTYAAHFKSMRELKHGRVESDLLAREYNRRDMKMMETLQSFEVYVTASRAGVKLGSSSLGGIDIDDDYSYLTGCVEEHGLIEEAIDAAKATLAKLCKCDDAKSETAR